MRIQVHLLILAVLWAVLVAVPAVAQDNVFGGYGPGAAAAEEGRANGRWFVGDPTTVARAELTRCCPTVSIEPCAVENTGRLPDRYSLLITRLGIVETKPLSMFRYRRETLFQDPAFAGVDRERQPYFSCRASRVLLVDETANDRYRLVWEGWQDELSHRLAEVGLHRLANSYVLAFTYCVDGTGGCWQELFIKTSVAAWRPLEKDDTWASVYAGMPDGFTLHKSPLIDFDSMTWDRTMATVNDPNCCPSGSIKMKLIIRDGRLSILSHEYVR